MLDVLKALALQGSCSGWRTMREGVLGSVLGSPSSSTSPEGAWSHLLFLAMGSGQSDSTAVHPTLPEQMCLKAQFSLF